MPFWPYFDPILSPPEPKFWPLAKMCLFSPLPRGTLEDLEGPLDLDLNWPFWDPFWGSWEEVAARPLTSCLWAGGPVSDLSNPCLGPPILVILTTFPIEKVQFLTCGPIRSQWNAILTYFDPILTLLSQTFVPGQECAWPQPGWTLEGPSGTILTLILTILGPLWGSWREDAARPTKLPLGWRDLLRPHKPMPRTSEFWSFWPLFLLKSQFCHFTYQGQWKCHFDPIFDQFDPSLERL